MRCQKCVPTKIAMGSVFLKRTVASRWLLCVLRGLCASFRANSVTWNPHKMMGVLLQCSAILIKEKVSTASTEMSWGPAYPAEDTRGEKHGVLSQCFRNSPDQLPHCPTTTATAVLCCSPTSPQMAQHLPLTGARGALPPCQSTGPCQGQAVRVVFHFTFHHVCADKSERNWVSPQLLTSVRTQSGHWSIPQVPSMNMCSQELE